MAEVGRWNGHIFEVSSNLVRSFSELSIKAGCETEEKTSGKQKYVVRKAGNAAEISLKVTLMAALGCDVRAEADAFASEAGEGAKDYFYVGGTKLAPCQLMLTQADVSEIETSPASGTWIAATVKLTMKQADKGDGNTSSGGGSSSGGSKKASVKIKDLVSTVASMSTAAAANMTAIREGKTQEASSTDAIKKIALATAQVKVAQEKSKNLPQTSKSKTGGSGKTKLMATR